MIDTEIAVYDDLITSDMLVDIRNYIESKGFQYGWKSNKKVNFSHWNLGFSDTGTSSKNREDILYELPTVVRILWEKIQPVVFKNYPTLIRAYCNAHTYGTEGYIHIDSKFSEDNTCVIYLNASWNPNWAGETVLFKGGEIIKAVIPKPNRVFVFPSNILHAARGVSRYCPVARTVLVFKATKSI